jgi:hypothetical protein
LFHRESAADVPSTLDNAATTTDAAARPIGSHHTPVAVYEEPTTPPKKPRKLKVKADAPPKKLSMMAAALKVLCDRMATMTCPELIDVMATEDLWTSPGGKTPANTLYAAISRDIKAKGDASAFRKAERGKF